MKKFFCLCFIASLISLQINAKSGYERHIVKRGETLFSISHLRGLKVNDLIKANPVLKANMRIRIGQQINIPAKPRYKSTGNKNNTGIEPAQAYNPHYKPIAVSATPDVAYSEEDKQVRKLNETSANAIASIANDNAVTARPEENTEKTAPGFSIHAGGINPDNYAALFKQYSEHGYKIAENKGAANCLEDYTSNNHRLALYNDAEVGSVIKVTNIMNKKTVYVKVVGRVSRIDASKEIVVKLTEKTAEELGAPDGKFLVDVEGVAP